MTDDSTDAELPEGITRGRLGHANEGDRVTDDYGDEWVVIQSKRTGKKHVVRPDVVEYGRFDHPALTGAGAFATIMTALVGPLVAVVVYMGSTPGLSGTQTGAFAFGSVALGYGLARGLLMHTFVGEFIARFLEWNDHRAIIEAGDLA